ncbi:MAG: hypothetical protein K1X72_25075 [Pyrinomonadaceae bacterium]|nr:hypothetical protein [Pyrinomonadaceae bacterium]
MGLNYFTLVHILISLVGIASGFGVLAGFLSNKLLRRWIAVYLVTTIATSVTGFFFPFNGITPGIIVGIISLIVLAIAVYSLYGQKLAGWWRSIFIITSTVALYFNCFVLIVQTFQKNSALVAIAPTQSEPPFAISQLALLVSFVWLGIAALRRFRND